MPVKTQYFCRIIVAVVGEIGTLLNLDLSLLLLDFVVLSLGFNFVSYALRLLNLHLYIL